MKLFTKNPFFLILLLFPILFPNCDKPKTSASRGLVQLHENVMTYILSEVEADSVVAETLANLNEAGFWPDIDYASQQRGGWHPASHVNRLLVMAKAYRNPQSAYYKDAAFSQKIHRVLNYWLDNDFICPNWWYPEIGIPMRLSPTLFLMEEELSDEQRAKAIKILDRAEIGKTGQNKVWLSGNVLYKSLLLGDESMVRKAAASIREELRMGDGEGVQPDWSFHQHGPQLQFGNYGLSYASDMIQWVRLFKDTPYAFKEDKISILRNYLLEGQQWVSWKERMDISACGRQLFVDAPELKAQSLARSFQKMETLDPKYAGKHKEANQYKTLAGHKHFWRSDFQVYRRPEYYFSVKMCSERVVGAESCNSENIQGYYMGDGAAFLYQTGREYENIFPFWDWKKVPGMTIQQDKEPLPVLTCSGYRLETDFVGGVSDGETGIAVLDYQRDGLAAKKSWFVFGDLIACLGAGIRSSQGHPVTTSISQIFQEGEPWVKEEVEKKMPEGSAELQNPKWIWHNHTGYVFPEGGNLTLETGSVTGSWNQVALRYPDEKQSADLFKLWFDHGINPTNGSYAYLIVPNATIKDMVRMESIPVFRVIRNDERMQAIVAEDESMAGVVFYEAGKIDVFGGIEADQPCLVMIRKDGDKVKIAVSDPTQKLKKIQLTLGGQFLLNDDAENITFDPEKSELTITLPQGGEAGKTVQVTS